MKVEETWNGQPGVVKGYSKKWVISRNNAYIYGIFKELIKIKIKTLKDTSV